jgi:hypothetical protein
MGKTNKLNLITALAFIFSVTNVYALDCELAADNIIGAYNIIDAIGCGRPGDFVTFDYNPLCPEKLSGVSQSLIDYKNNCNLVKDKSYTETIKIVNKLTDYSKLYPQIKK